MRRQALPPPFCLTSVEQSATLLAALYDLDRAVVTRDAWAPGPGPGFENPPGAPTAMAGGGQRLLELSPIRGGE